LSRCAIFSKVRSDKTSGTGHKNLLHYFAIFRPTTIQRMPHGTNHTFAQQAIVIPEKIQQLDSLKQKMEGPRNARAA
jgi:hypothetical protein